MGVKADERCRINSLSDSLLLHTVQLCFWTQLLFVENVEFLTRPVLLIIYFLKLEVKPYVCFVVSRLNYCDETKHTENYTRTFASKVAKATRHFYQTLHVRGRSRQDRLCFPTNSHKQWALLGGGADQRAFIRHKKKHLRMRPSPGEPQEDGSSRKCGAAFHLGSHTGGSAWVKQQRESGLRVKIQEFYVNKDILKLSGAWCAADVSALMNKLTLMLLFEP